MNNKELRKNIIRNRITDEELKLYYDDDITNVYNRPSYNIFHNLNIIKDIDKGSDILLETVSRNGVIAISCDFDTDGILGLKVLKYLIEEKLQFNSIVVPIIGGRRFGRGLCENVINKLKKVKNVLNKNIDLLITVDHGTSDNVAFKELKEYYPTLKIILTDHHTVEYENYPECVDAFINPQREDDNYNKNICGTMVAFLLGIYTHYKKTGIQCLSEYDNIIPYVTISTVSDVMSMKDPLNRFLVQTFTDNNSLLDSRLRYITKKLGLTSDLTYQDISLSLAPFINTGNRLGVEVTMLAAMIIKDEKLYRTNIDKMIKLNKFRKAEVNYITNKLLSEFKYTNNINGIVLTVNNTKCMLSGVIAGNISGMYNRPTICFTDTDNDVLAGSGRSGIENLNVLEIIRNIQKDNPNLIISANGHKSAFGISINKNNLTKFKEIFNDYCSNVMKKIEIKDATHEFEIDSEEINISLARMILKTGPYGLHFSNPVFLIKNLYISEIVPIKTFFKLTFCTPNKGQPMSGMIFFKHKSKLCLNFNNFTTVVKKNSKVNILAHIATSTYENSSYVHLDILDIYYQYVNN